ncbi:MAG: hypothetical protein R2728_13565 [Chitinophagales bacterium]
MTPALLININTLTFCMNAVEKIIDLRFIAYVTNAQMMLNSKKVNSLDKASSHFDLNQAGNKEAPFFQIYGKVLRLIHGRHR